MFEVRSPFLWPAILFAIAGALDVVTAPSMTAALGLYRAYLLEPMAFALVLANVVRNPQRAMLVAGGLMAGGHAFRASPSSPALLGLLHAYRNTVQRRLDLWTGAGKIIQQRPLFGAGLSGFQERVAPFLTNFHASAFFIDPHNILLNFWVETGLLGVVAIAWIIGAAMWIS